MSTRSSCKTFGEDVIFSPVLSPKTRVLYEGDGLEYLQYLVSLAFTADTKNPSRKSMKKKPSITQASHQNSTGVSKAAVTHCQKKSLIRVKEETGWKVQKPVKRKGNNNVTLSSLVPLRSWNELGMHCELLFSWDSETPGKRKFRKAIILKKKKNGKLETRVKILLEEGQTFSCTSLHSRSYLYAWRRWSQDAWSNCFDLNQMNLGMLKVFLGKYRFVT